MDFSLKNHAIAGKPNQFKELENSLGSYSHTGGRWFKSITAYQISEGVADFGL